MNITSIEGSLNYNDNVLAMKRARGGEGSCTELSWHKANAYDLTIFNVHSTIMKMCWP